MNFEEKTLTKNYIYKGKILSLKRDEVILPDQTHAFREIVEHSGGCAVLCEDDGKILMVKQYRYAYGEEVWEIPAGKRNPNEPPEVTAKRELEEEGGIRADKLEKMFEIYPTPGYTDEVIYLYRAVSFKKTQSHLDDGEFLDCQWVDKQTLKDMIKDGRIKDGKTLIALLSVL